MLQMKFHMAFDAVRPDDALLARTRAAMHDALCASRRTHRTVYAVAACACALLLCVPLALRALPQKAAVPSPTQQQAIQTPLAPGEHQPTVQLSGGLLIFNDTDTATDAARLYFDPETTRTEQWTQDRIVQYLGRDVRPQRLPTGLSYQPGGRDDAREVIVDLQGQPLYAAFTYNYSNVPADTFDAYARELHIQVQRESVPFQCGMYLPDTLTVSHVGKLEITVGYTRMPQGPFAPRGVPSGYTDVYFASFVRDGLGYYVSSQCLSQAEFIDVLLQLAAS